MAKVVVLLLAIAVSAGLAGQEQPRFPSLKVVVVEEGTGLPLVNVSLWITTATADGRQATTGGDGSATLYDLPPGKYNVHASSPTHLINASGRAAIVSGRSETLSLRMIRGGVIAGTVTDRDGNPLANSRVTLVNDVGGQVGAHPFIGRLKVAVTNAEGIFEFAGLSDGEYRVCAIPVTGGGTFNEVYYPSTIEVEKSELVKVALGDRRNLTLRVPRVPWVRVQGRVSDDVVADRRQLTVRRLDVDTGDAISHILIEMRRDGTFSVDLEAGVHGFTYTISDRTLGTNAVAYAVVHVGEAPVPPVNLRPRLPATISGRFVFDGTSQLSTDRLHVRALPIGEDALLRSIPNTEVTDGGKFVLRPLPGRYRLAVQTPDGWLPSAILLDDGRDLLHNDFDVESPRDYPNVRVVLTDDIATIEGTIPLPVSSMVMAFPVDEATWWDRESTPARTVEDDGRFRITNIRPWTEYYVTECPWPCMSRHKDLEKYAQTAVRVRVGPPGIYSVVLKR